MSRRVEQIAAELRRAVQQVLAKGLSDPRVRGMITVTGVTVSDDLRQATISVSVLPEEHQELTLHGLRAAARFVRREAGELVAMKRLPEFVFRLDHQLKRQAATLEAIARARAELEAKNQDAPPAHAHDDQPEHAEKEPDA